MRSVVIGGGISGLTCAFRLRQLGLDVILLEQADRLGGVIASVEQDGFLFELGPQSFLATERLRELISSLNLGDELLEAHPRAPRFVLVKGLLHPVPMALPALLSTSLLSASTKWHLAKDLFLRTRPPETDESVADFVRRKFGQELLERLVEPFVSGVYAGDPEQLSLRSAFPSAYQWEKECGSLVRGAMKSRPPRGTPRPALCSFRGGMASLVRSFGEKLGDTVHTHTAVRELRCGKANGGSGIELQAVGRGRAESLRADAVVLATPARTSGSILRAASPGIARHLATIPYAPVAVVAGGYRREQVQHPLEGFGFLVPRKERLRVLGTVWSSSLFSGRAPDGMISLASFAGGATDPGLLTLTAEEIAKTVEAEIAGVLRVSGPPVARMVQRWPQALPQYNLGHGATLAAIQAELVERPGLFLAGNYFDGPSIGACVEQALRTADQVHAYLGSAVARSANADLAAKS